MPGHAPGQDVPHRVQVRAPVVVDDAFGPARRPRGVAQRDRLPLIRRLGPLIPRRRTRKQRLVVLFPQPVPRPVVLGIVDVDDQRARLAQPQCLGYHRGEFPVGDQYPGLGVIEDVGDRRGVQPGVDRVQHRAGHRDPEVRLDHLRGIRRDHRHRVPTGHAPRRQRRGEPLAPLACLRPGEPPPAVDHGQPVRIDVRGPVQEHQRRQRRVVRRIRLQPHQIDVTHSPSATSTRSAFPAQPPPAPARWNPQHKHAPNQPPRDRGAGAAPAAPPRTQLRRRSRASQGPADDETHGTSARVSH